MATDDQSANKGDDVHSLPVMPGEAELLAPLFEDVLKFVLRTVDLDD